MIKCKKGDVAIEGTMATQEEAEKMLVISEATTRALDSFYEER